MYLWRIAAETRAFKADDITGGGAALYPGRWNAEGERVVYTGQTLSLAALETVAHLDDLGLPLNRFVVRLTVPSAVWRARETRRLSTLDPAWCAIPGGKASVDVGSAWYRSGKSALLQVPSVVVPEEYAVIINASHPDARVIEAETLRPFEFNRVVRS